MNRAVDFRKQLALIFAALALFSGRATQCVENACELSRLNRVFASSYHSDAIYQCSFCFFNSGELARQARRVLGADFDEKALNILVIKHKALPDPTVAPEHIRLNQLVLGLNPRHVHKDAHGLKYALWKYHAVLEYRGQILDLDRKSSPRAIPAIEYFEEMFNFIHTDITKPTSTDPKDHVPQLRSFNYWDQMHLFLIPVSEYFRRFPERPFNQSETNLSFVWDSPSIEVWDYLLKYR